MTAGARPRRVAVVTGTRAEYGLLRSVMQAIARHPRLRLQVVATGMHLLRRFGGTIRELEHDGWHVAARVPMQSGSDGVLDQARGLARGVAGIARFLAAARTDIVVVLGDRIEALAGALAAVTSHRVLAHIHGGDVAPGDLDDGLRHAITKLAHVHFAATPRSARRIARLGEHPEHIHVVGAPGLDELRALLAAARGRVRERRGQALVVHHPCGRPAPREEAVMTALLDAVAAADLRRVIIYPNTDRGHSGILRAIRRHCRASPPGQVQVVRSLPRQRFLATLLEVNVLVGNSSAGIIEAPLAGTPVVNVGSRQAGREPGGRGVIHAGESRSALRAALARALRLRVRPPRRTPYGDGRAGRRIAAHLARLPLTPALRRKAIRY